MGLIDQYKPVFDAVKSTLSGVTSIKSVFLAEAFRLTDLPIAIVSPRETVFTRETLNDLTRLTIRFDVFIIIRETEPSDWFTEIVTVLCDAHDALGANPTLNGTVKDLQPLILSPGEITAQNKLYYGGLLSYEATVLK